MAGACNRSTSEYTNHMENVHYFHDAKGLEDALFDPKAHWDNLEERKASEHAIETLFQEQSILDDYVEELGGGGVGA